MHGIGAKLRAVSVAESFEWQLRSQLDVDGPQKLHMHFRELIDKFAEAVARKGHATICDIVDDE